MKFRIPALAAALLCCLSCVDVNYRLGENLIPGDQMYRIYTAETAVTDIALCHTDSLTGYSSRRITIGAIRDGDFGLSRRNCALTIVPLSTDMDFGENPEFISFHLSAEKDTVSVSDPSQVNILQNLRVYELSRPIRVGVDHGGNEDMPHGNVSIVRGTPVINGSDSLSLDFTEDFGKRFLTITKEELASYDKYVERFPGIYIEAEPPAGNGGRFNIFKLQLDYDSSAGTLLGNYAMLQTRGTYNGVVKDTLFCFFLGADGFYNADSLLTNSATGKFPEYALNITKHESSEVGTVSGKILVEGGGGLKPVVRAMHLRDVAREAIAACGEEPDGVIINKASLILPYEFPEDYTEMNWFAPVLSPSVRYAEENYTSFMNITDASSSEENQGDIQRGFNRYAPDITYHLQAILDQSEDKLKSGNYDIWLMIKAYETITTNASTQSIQDYNQQMAYQNYYYQMYGYGGYGTNDYYSNYYYWSAMNSSATTSSTTTQLLLDQDRYYRTVLNGYDDERHPSLELTFSIPID